MKTEETIDEVYERTHPRPWFFFSFCKPQPTIRQLIVNALEDCERDRLKHAHAAEYHSGIVDVCQKRVKRLQKELDALASPAEKETSQ